MSFHRPAHNLAAERVEHHRQVKQAGPGWNVADVGDPQTIGRRRREVVGEQRRYRLALALEIFWGRCIGYTNRRIVRFP